MGAWSICIRSAFGVSVGEPQSVLHGSGDAVFTRPSGILRLKLAESASNQKRPPALLGLHVGDREDGDALLDRLIEVTFDDESSTLRTNKPLADKVSSVVSSLLPPTSVALDMVSKALDASMFGIPVSVITGGTCFIVDLIITERDRKDLFLAELGRITY